MQTETIRTRGSRSEGKGYVAKVTGMSGRYGFEREFLPAASTERGDGPDRGYEVSTYEVKPGTVYEVRPASRAGEKRYHVYDGSDYETLEADEVREHLAGKPLSELLVLISS